MRSGTLLNQKRKASHRQTSLRSWQRWLLALHIAFFALILPFICWGTLVDPTHPHTHNHFVFAEPPHVDDQNSSAQLFSRFLGDNRTVDKSSHAVTTTTPATGQSTPDTLLITLLSLFVVLITSLQPETLRLRLWVFDPLFAHGHLPIIPTPPPQFINCLM